VVIVQWQELDAGDQRVRVEPARLLHTHGVRWEDVGDGRTDGNYNTNMLGHYYVYRLRFPSVAYVLEIPKGEAERLPIGLEATAVEVINQWWGTVSGIVLDYQVLCGSPSRKAAIALWCFPQGCRDSVSQKRRVLGQTWSILAHSCRVNFEFQTPGFEL
jgi:hypothetical protein